jgi:pilus assembly protein CpaE
MAKPNTALIVSRDPAVVDTLLPELRPVVGLVKTADGAEAALAACREQVPALLIVDLSENDGSGLKLLHRIRQRFPDTSVIAVAGAKDPDLILEGLRSGISDFLALPLGKDDIRTAVQRALRRDAAPRPAGEIIALFSLKGGQGVTTLALNLADQLQTVHGKRVLLLDLNLYMGQVGAYLNLPAGYSPFDLLRDIERIDENLLFSSLSRHPRGFYFLTAPEVISDADEIGADDVRRMLALLAEHFDAIVVDLPHNFADKTLAVMEAAEHLLLVTVQGIIEIKSVQRTLELLSELQYREDKVKIVLNRFLRNRDLGVKELTELFQQPIYATVTNDYRTLNQAADKHRLVAETHSKTRICRDIRNLTGKLLGAAAGAHRPGLFGLIRKMSLNEA